MYPAMKPPPRKRGLSLASFLILGALAAVFSLVSDVIEYVALKSQMARDIALFTDTRVIQKSLKLDMMDSALRLVCVMAMWSWKRWGMYAYVALSALSMVLARKIDPESEVDFDAAIGVASVLIATLPRWKWFE